MVKIKHNKTGEVRKVDRYYWETKPEYKHNRGAWTILNPGDPVILMRIINGKHYEEGLWDRDEADQMIKAYPDKYHYYQEVDANELQPKNNHVPFEKTSRQKHDDPALQVRPEYRVKPTSDSKYTIWDKIKYIGGVFGAIATMLTVLQQCSGKL